MSDTNKLIGNEEDKSQNQKQHFNTKKRFFFTKRIGANRTTTNDSTSEQPQNTNEDIEKEETCSHEIIIKDMCGNCGKDLRIKGGFSGERTEPVDANVSMIHHVPELVVSNEIASQLGARDHENILRQRKLILLLDLDQTLVHTSNRPLKPCEAAATNMFGYQLFGCTYYTKIRPYTHHFLEHINKLYELHIVTFGQRMYAHKIAELLDPNKIYFDYRILSRDELLSSIHKTGNLKALFPCSEQLVLMLDDRPDVWMHSDALIRLKPYRFFLNVGDINYPMEKENKEENVEVKKIIEQSFDDNNKEKKETDGNTEIDVKKVEDVIQKDNEQSNNSEIELNKCEGEKLNQKFDLPDELSKPITPLSDNDNALVHIERILKEVHSIFYEHYDREGKVPNVKNIVSWLRSQVLKGERIVFSGIVPLGTDINKCEIYQLCTQFGAKVGEKIVKGETTVLVAAKAGTEKIRLAKRLRIPIVSIRWLENCYERWQKVDKRDFLFCEDDCSINDFGNFIQPKRSKSLCSNAEMDHFSQMDILNKKALQEMENEVDCALYEDDDDTNGYDDGGGGGASTSSSFYPSTFNTEKEEEPEFISDNNNIKLDNLPNLNEEENSSQYIDLNDIPSNLQDNEEKEEEEEDDQSYFDYGNEHLSDKEVSDSENISKQFEGDSDTNDLNEDYDEIVADIEQNLNKK